jgi:type II secretory pathway pseudopilin PulG
MKKRNGSVGGFSLVELLVGTVLFTIITGAVFSLLVSAQRRYRGESSVTEAFQQANVAIDQIVRDVHSAGYPPKNSFGAAVSSAHPENYALPFAWSPNYPGTPCTLGTAGNCVVPGNNDLVVEADTGNGVQWIRYRYSPQNGTLMRGVTRKAKDGDPATATNDDLAPYLDNVINPPSVPVFSYRFDNTTPPPPSQPPYIREVDITLIVQSAQRDPQTRQFRTITLTGQATRFNPNQ